jgi:hypothetical protein
LPNQNGNMYGLTILSPIIDDPTIRISHDTALRMYLEKLPRHEDGPFTKVSATHLCRLVVMDDVVFVGAPAKVEHLQSKYLVFTSNFYGDLDTYLADMAAKIPDVVNDIWSHCVGYPGVSDPRAFAAYMKNCQIETTFFFADVNNKTVEQTLRALQTKVEFGAFVEENQGKSPAELQAAFSAFWQRLKRLPVPRAGAKELTRVRVTGTPGDRS